MKRGCRGWGGGCEGVGEVLGVRGEGVEGWVVWGSGGGEEGGGGGGRVVGAGEEEEVWVVAHFFFLSFPRWGFFVVVGGVFGVVFEGCFGG